MYYNVNRHLKSLSQCCSNLRFLLNSFIDFFSNVTRKYYIYRSVYKLNHVSVESWQCFDGRLESCMRRTGPIKRAGFGARDRVLFAII